MAITWFTTSWDDGHPLDRRLAELMAQHGIRGTFYCPLRNREGLPVMQAADLRALDGAFEIGSHTLEHTYAGRLSSAQWTQQVAHGKAALEQLLGHAVAGFCYPGGQMALGNGSDARAAVAAVGFTHARSSENFRTDRGDDRLRMPTTLQFYPHARQVLLRNFITRGRWPRRWPLALACVSARDFESRLQCALQRSQAQGGGFHLWGHSWEIERQGLWPVLARFFAHVAQTVPPAARLDNAAVAATLVHPA